MASTREEPRANVAVVTFHEMIAIRLQNQIVSLSNAGYDVTVFNWNRGGPYQGSGDIERASVEPIYLPAPEGLTALLFLPLYYIKLYSVLREDSIDIIHCGNLLLLPCCLLSGRNTAIILDQREMYSKSFTDFGPDFVGKLLERIYNRIEATFVRRVDHVFTVDSIDNFLVRKYEEYCPNVDVLYNAPTLELDVNEAVRDEVADQYVGESVLVYVGQVTGVKGLWKILEAMTELDDVLLLLIGRLKESAGDVEEFLLEHELEDRVKLIGWVPYPEMMGYLQVADIGLAAHQPTKIFESVSIGNGRKIPTYMEASLPVIAPEFGEIGDIVTQYDCGIQVNTTDPSAIADGVSYFLNNPETATEMGVNGRMAIETEFNWHNEESKLLQAYDRITKQTY